MLREQRHIASAPHVGATGRPDHGRRPKPSVPKKKAGPREADRPFLGRLFQVSAYCMLNWALVPGVLPQSYSCMSAPFAVLGPWMFRQRPEATFWKAYTPEVDIGSAV